MRSQLRLRALTLALTLISLPVLNATSAEDYSDLFERVDPSVVTIQTISFAANGGSGRVTTGVGSGVIVHESLILTAAHVVDSADRIVVKYADGTTVRAAVLASISSGDIAMLRVEKIPESARVATTGHSKDVRIGSEVAVIGAPLGVEHSLSIGHVSGKVRRPIVSGGAPLELVQTDAAINPGNSGGPVFNRKGEVIGIVSHILSEGGGSDGLGFAVAIDTAMEMVQNASSFWTGFDAMVLNSQAAGVLNVPQGGGLLIQRVVAGSAADRAGLRGGVIKTTLAGKTIWLGGDVILEIQQSTCRSHQCVRRIRRNLAELEPGKPINIKVLRAGKILELELEHQEQQKLTVQRK